MTRPRVSKEKQKVIAHEQIDRLFKLAAAVFLKDKERANRYVALARKIAMKVKLRLPRHYKRRYCKHCYAYLQPGVNSRIRTRGGKVIISCFECKKFMRIPLRSKS